ncbi:VIT1/CCC1 family predicted Fe2+/Mn2+ transporter [Streptacidiphilus sp. BW17]|uniref:VIT1/CCC1 transporter family protein n=1 Tax=Streptacidiphilus sp. BW17 TaxID=3156274 RepID=UPI003514192F
MGTTSISPQLHSPADQRAARARFRAALDAERQSAVLYRALADGAEGERRQILLELAAIEDRHAAHWEHKLTELGESVPQPGRVGPRVRVLSWLARRYSVDLALPFVERAERADSGLYLGDPDAAPGMAADERSHARVLTRLREDGAASAGPQGEAGGRGILRRERWHRSDRSGALRAGVFGVNDGLVSNGSLVLGFAGSGAAPATVLFAGVAGLLAGAFSMAAGEYISMRSQRESYERELSQEAAELQEDPEAEAEELALIYRAKGLSAEEAQQVAATIMKNPDSALETMAREELGLDPDELGSPWAAALSSLLAFALGAVVVILPYLFGGGGAALATAVGLTGLALFTVGGALGLVNGRPVLRSGFRQLLVGGGAALLVFVFGHVIGAGGLH